MIANSAEKSELEAREARLDIWMYVGMVLVLLGVIIETLPDFLHAEQWVETTEHRLGGGFVAFGLLLEFVADMRLHKVRAKSKEIADREFAEINERAAKAEQAAAEANLARAQIEQRMRPRNLADASAELRKLLTEHSFRFVDLVVYDNHVPETQAFAMQLFALFRGVGWRLNQWESANGNRFAGASTMVVLAIGEAAPFMDLAANIASIMNGLGIECSVRPEGFNAKAEFDHPQYRLTRNEPLMVMGGTKLSPFRIQIGAKQITTSGRTKIVRVSSK